MKHAIVLIFALLQFLLVGSAANAALLTIVGVCVDNNVFCDADPTQGIIVLTVVTPNGFLGTVREIETPDSYKIIASPATLKNPGGTEVFTGHYGSFIGPGVLRAKVTGVLDLAPGGMFPDLTGGAETLGVAADASSFDNNPAITSGTAPRGLPIPRGLSGLDTNEGNYNGSGTLTAWLTWGGLTSAGGQPEQILLPKSAEYEAVVPEPGSLFISAVGLVFVGCFGRTRRGRGALSFANAARFPFRRRCCASGVLV